MAEMDQYRIPVLEAFPWQEPVLTQTISSPPANVSKGDRYLLPGEIAPTSLWNGYENHIAWFDGFNWHYDNPMPGWVVYIVDQDAHYRFTGDAWVPNYLHGTEPAYKELYVSAHAAPGGNGSEEEPYDRINDAIEHIILAGDNEDNPYVINVGPGSYPEMVVLENESLFNLHIKGSGPDVSIIDACCGRSVRSGVRNNCLYNLRIDGFTFADPVELVGKVHETGIGTVLVFNDCYFKNNAHLLFENISNPIIMGNTVINGNITFSNVAFAQIFNTVQINGQLDENDFIIKTNPSDNTPLGWDGKTKVFLSCSMDRHIDWRLLNGGEGYLQVRMGGQLGIRDEDFWLPERAIIDANNSTLYGNWELNGDLILNGSFVNGTIIKNLGTVDLRGQPISQIYDDSVIKSKYGTGNTGGVDWSLKDSLNAIGDKLDDFEDNIAYDQSLRDIILDPTKIIP